MSRIPTYRSIAERVADRTLMALDRHQWLPLAVVLVALYFINS